MDKRQHIIQTAIGLFAEWGFDNTSIREISQKAGVNVAMINYYFGSKEKLFEAMIEYKSTYLKARLEELFMNKSLSDIDKIMTIIEEYVTRILSNPNYHRILHQELLLNTRPELNAGIRSLLNQNFSTIKKIILEGIENKAFKQVDPDLTIASVFGTINHIMLAPAVYSENKQLDPCKDEAVRTRIINHLQQLMRAHLLNR